MKLTTKISIIFLVIILIFIRINIETIRAFIDAKFSRGSEEIFSSEQAKQRLLEAKIDSRVTQDKSSGRGNNLLNLAVSAGTTTKNVLISECVPNPTSVIVDYGDEITFINTTNKRTVIGFVKIPEIVLTTNKPVVVKSSDLVNKSSKTGIMSVVSYSCNEGKYPVGFITISN